MTGRVAGILAIGIVWTGLVGFSAIGWLLGTRAFQRRASWKAPHPRPLRLHLALLAPFYAVFLAIGVAWALFDIDAGSFGDILRWWALFTLPFAVTVTLLLIRREVPPKGPQRLPQGVTLEQAAQRQTRRGSLAIGVAFLGTIALGSHLAGWAPWQSLPIYDAAQFSIAYPADWEVLETAGAPEEASPGVDAFPEVSFRDPGDGQHRHLRPYVLSRRSPRKRVPRTIVGSTGDVLREQEIEVPGAAGATLEEVEGGLSLFAQEEVHQIGIIATTNDNQLVHVVLTAPEEDFDSYEAMFDRIIESFRLPPS